MQQNAPFLSMGASNFSIPRVAAECQRPRDPDSFGIAPRLGEVTRGDRTMAMPSRTWDILEHLTILWCVYIYIYMYVCMCIYIYIHIHIHMHICPLGSLELSAIWPSVVRSSKGRFSWTTCLGNLTWLENSPAGVWLDEWMLKLPAGREITTEVLRHPQ